MKRWIQPLFAAALLCLLALPAHADEPAGAWKTAYFKRGFVGDFQANWAGGVGGVQRMRTPLQFGGSKFRVQVNSSHGVDFEITKMSLIRGEDDQGKITGDPFAVMFKGEPALKMPMRTKPVFSDEAVAPIVAGTWYLQDSYAGEKFPYAYDVDRGYAGPADQAGAKTLAKVITCRTGAAYRVDVFTTDPRMSIVCYGDSITAGYGSTPNADKRYPAMLGKLLDRPVLNLGVNGDLALWSRGIPPMVNSLQGVDTVVYLMGINDIVSGQEKVSSAEAYGAIVKELIDSLHRSNKKIYLGTILPAGGHAGFDKAPAKETLRGAINAWIRAGHGADGVIDFDAALADPENPRKMRAEYQSDWIHPSDKGYEKMAETAAKALGGK